jgi:hypothetical protein
MSTPNDSFEVLVVEEETDVPAALSRRGGELLPGVLPGGVTGRIHGFDLDDQPLLVGLPGLGHEVVVTRTTVPLLRRHIGATVVVIFDQGDVRQPIVIGVLHDGRSTASTSLAAAPLVSAEVDDQRIVLTAEREIVLRCGDASITLTRAGKVLIKGTYILSRSSGCNKIKGAAVDIN